MSTDHAHTAVGTDQFAFIRQFAEREAGIIIDPGKEYLVESRLATVASRRGLPSPNAVIDHLRFSPDRQGTLTNEVVDALTTNETLFFRDTAPFDALRDQLIPEFRAANPGRLMRLWSAACSSGQEPYSLAMLVADSFPDQKVQIFATDICSSILERARRGIYQRMEINRGLPAKLLVKHFRQVPEGWQIAESLRQRVEFSPINLTRPWPTMPPINVLFLRNVMIYFDVETRKRILKQVRNVLAPGGYLSLGGAETTMNLDPTFEAVRFGRATFYRAV
ncbi:MAG TPA: protein-glutamate O-methyltransferase CheR [Opitutaceae bacterium]|jgi:chemotaxis protein methyltransferase CheR